MKMYLKNRLRKKILKRTLIQLTSILVLIILLLILFILRHKDVDITFMIIPIFIAAALITASSFKRKFKLKLNTEDVELLKIILVFMQMKRAFVDLNTLYIKGIFNPYYDKNLFDQVNLYKSVSIDHDESLKILSAGRYDLKLFLIETLLDIALSEGYLSNKEEDFLNKVGKTLKINSYSFENIKLDYVKRGLKKEKRSYNGNDGKRYNESYNLLTACKTLDVTPTVTAKQLKKSYRTLVKKYHPDRYHRNSDEMIQRAQVKFHEVKMSYEIIMRHKAF